MKAQISNLQMQPMLSINFSTKVYSGLITYIILVPYYYFSPSIFPVNIIVALKYLPVFLLTIAFIPLLTPDNLSFTFRKFRVPFYLMGIYFFVGLCSLWDAENKTTGLLRFIYYNYTTVGSLYISLMVGQCFSKTNSIFRCIFFSVSASSIYSFFIAFFGLDLLKILDLFTWTMHMDYQSVRLSGTLGNPVAYGSLLMLTLPVLILYLVRTRSLVYTFTVSSLIIIYFLNISATSSRSAFIFSVLLVIFCLYAFSKHLDHRGNLFFKKLTAPLLICSSIAFFIIPMDNAFDLLANRLSMLGDIKNDQSGRLSQYIFAFSTLNEQPFLGIGTGQLVDSIRLGSYPRGLNQDSITTDNQFLMIAVETGFLGLTAFISLIFAGLFQIYKNLKQKITAESTLYGLASTASVIGLLFNMMTWDAINQPTMRILFWTMFGLALSLSNPDTINTIPKEKNKHWM